MVGNPVLNMNLQHYLRRINFGDTWQPNLETLARLLRTHVCAVPFENLDVQLGRPLTIDVEHAYDKIVNRHRGGWCYEQNGLFGWALSQIGFDVTRIAASVMRQERGAAADSSHLCLLVRVPETPGHYLVDVGFGGSMIHPLSLAEGEHDQPPFQLGLRSLDNGDWRFWEDIGSGEFSFDFTEVSADESAMSDKCNFLQSDPASSFVLNLVAQLRLPEQHKTLRGKVLTISTRDGAQSRILDSADELVATLADHFGLDVPEIADVWPRVEARHEDIS